MPDQVRTALMTHRYRAREGHKDQAAPTISGWLHQPASARDGSALASNHRDDLRTVLAGAASTVRDGARLLMKICLLGCGRRKKCVRRCRAERRADYDHQVRAG